MGSAFVGLEEPIFSSCCLYSFSIDLLKAFFFATFGFLLFLVLRVLRSTLLDNVVFCLALRSTPLCVLKEQLRPFLSSRLELVVKKESNKAQVIGGFRNRKLLLIPSIIVFKSFKNKTNKPEIKIEKNEISPAASGSAHNNRSICMLFCGIRKRRARAVR